MLEHYRLASTNISSTYKKAEPVVVLPQEYLETLFNKKINKLVEGDYNVDTWVTDMNAFDQKFIDICQK
jgi:hypothetical protein